MRKPSTLKTLNIIGQALYDKKGFNILALDVRGISSLADYVVIAEGNIDRHLKALAGSLKDALQETDQSPLYVEGEQTADWIVIDCGEVVIHLFIPELREKYGLEELWRKAKIVDLKIKVESNQKAKRKHE